jgi:hypothetical protein
MPWFFNSSHGIATCYPIHKLWAAEMFRHWRITSIPSEKIPPRLDALLGGVSGASKMCPVLDASTVAAQGDVGTSTSFDLRQMQDENTVLVKSSEAIT